MGSNDKKVKHLKEAMSRLKQRIEQLEHQAIDRELIKPVLAYLMGINETSSFESAKKEYKQRNGFDHTESIKIQVCDGHTQADAKAETCYERKRFIQSTA